MELMDRTTSPGKISATRIICACLGALLLVAGLNALSFPAQAAGETTEPVYPSAPPAQDSEDEGSVLIPSVTSQEGQFYLAVTDAALDNVDQEQIMDAVREAVAGQNTKILLGVDQEPNNLKGAAQLVRGMLLFGDSDAMADDWLENGKELGYVGKGWIAIGVMLPETSGDPVQVYVDPGRDVSETQPGGRDAVMKAGAAEFAAGDYTEGTIAVALDATKQLQAPADKTLVKLIALGVLALLVIVGIIWALLAKKRKAKGVQVAQRAKEAEVLVSKIHRGRNFLARRHVPEPGLPATSTTSAIFAGIQERRTQVLALPPTAESQNPSERELNELRAREQELSQLGSAIILCTELAGTPAKNRDTWRGIFGAHTAKVEELALFLDLPGASDSHCAPAVRTVIITHTDALRQLRREVEQRGAGTRESLAVLEKLWPLREELDQVCKEARGELRKGSVKGEHRTKSTQPFESPEGEDGLGLLIGLAGKGGSR